MAEKRKLLRNFSNMPYSVLLGCLFHGILVLYETITSFKTEGFNTRHETFRCSNRQSFISKKVTLKRKVYSTFSCRKTCTWVCEEN